MPLHYPLTASSIAATDTDLDDTLKGDTGNNTLGTDASGSIQLTREKGSDQFVVSSDQTVTVTELNTNNLLTPSF